VLTDWSSDWPRWNVSRMPDQQPTDDNPYL
jgi:hypothetical protein